MTELLTDEQKLQEALDLLQGTLNATSITRVDRIKAAVCGKGKTGKSNVVARTCRKPLLDYDFDDRRESIAGIDGVTIKTLVDLDHTSPKAWGEFEKDLNTLVYLKQQNKLPFRSICVDSVTYLRQFAENQMMKDTKNERVYQIGNQKYHIAQGWDSIVSVQKMLTEALYKMFSLDIDVYWIFHTSPEKDKAKSSKENIVYTDKETVDPNNLSILLPKFNEVWRTYIEADGTYKLQTKADYYFNAATALHIDGIEEQDIQKLLDKHNTKV